MQYSRLALISLISLLFLVGCSGSSGSGSGYSPIIPTATLVSIEVSSSGLSASVASTTVGSVVQFIATGHYSDGSAIDITALVAWSTSDPLVATVNSSGLVTFTGFGDVTVIASDPQTGISSESTGSSLLVRAIISGTVVPLYSSKGKNWNDYVDNDGFDIFSASASVCPGTGTGYDSCIHAGALRAVEVTGRNSCAGLVATDSLGAFDWICDSNTAPVRMITTGLKSDKALSDLIDFNTPAWKDNAVTVTLNGTPILMSAQAKWWSNPIIENNAGSDGSETSDSEILVVTTDTTADYMIKSNKLGFVIRPGVTLTGYIYAVGVLKHIWVEGAIDSAGSEMYCINFHNIDFSVIHNVTANNATKYGLVVGRSSNNKLRKIRANGNPEANIWLWDASENNTLSEISANGPSGYGLNIKASANNRLNNITVSNNTTGIYIWNASDNTTLCDVTANGNGWGVTLGEAYNNIICDIVASNNAIGVPLFTSSNNTLSNIAASNNSDFGIRSEASSNNYFTGLLKVGDNTSQDCSVSGGTNPGIDGACNPTDASDFALTNGITVASSFVNAAGGDFALLATDNVLRGVLAIPTGNDAITHTWSDLSITVLLRNAVEIQGDGIGNDDTLCESNEDCLYTPNIGNYQGHGSLISAGPFTNGTITGVTLWKYYTNGY